MTSSIARRTTRSLRSTRGRAMMTLGVVLGLGTVGTLAYWTDSATLTSGTFQAGSLEIQVDGVENDPVGFSEAFKAANLAPGQSVAASSEIQNVGTLTANYHASATATGGLAPLLTYSVRAGGTVNTSGTACSGGQEVFTGGIGTGTTVIANTAATLRTLLPQTGAESFCVTATLPSGTTTGQGQSATVKFTITAKQVGAP